MDIAILAIQIGIWSGFAIYIYLTLSDYWWKLKQL